MGGGITNTVQDRGARGRSSVAPPLHHPTSRRRRRCRCDRSSYKRSLFSRIRGGPSSYLTSSVGELQTSGLPLPSPFGWCGFEPPPGWKLPASILRDSATHYLHQSTGGSGDIRQAHMMVSTNSLRAAARPSPCPKLPPHSTACRARRTHWQLDSSLDGRFLHQYNPRTRRRSRLCRAHEQRPEGGCRGCRV